MRSNASLLGRLRLRYLRGAGSISTGLLNCFLTCVAGAVANVAFEHWAQMPWDLLARRIVVGYMGAAGVVVLVFPWLQRVSPDRQKPLSAFDGGNRIGVDGKEAHSSSEKTA